TVIQGFESISTTRWPRPSIRAVLHREDRVTAATERTGSIDSTHGRRATSTRSATSTRAAASLVPPARSGPLRLTVWIAQSVATTPTFADEEIAVPSRNQIDTIPVAVLRHSRSTLPSALKSPDSTIAHGAGTVPMTALDETATPFISQIAVLPTPSR